MTYLDADGEGEDSHEWREQLGEADDFLRRLGTAIRSERAPETEIERALQRCREKIRAGSSYAPAAPQLASLHALLTPICGTLATAHLLSSAGGAADWNGFVAQLAALVRRLCGETAAQLVVETASL